MGATMMTMWYVHVGPHHLDAELVGWVAMEWGPCLRCASAAWAVPAVSGEERGLRGLLLGGSSALWYFAVSRGRTVLHAVRTPTVLHAVRRLSCMLCPLSRMLCPLSCMLCALSRMLCSLSCMLCSLYMLCPLSCTALLLPSAPGIGGYCDFRGR